MDVGDLLNHPNLVQLLEYDDTDGTRTSKRTKWEYCNAGTLNQLILVQDGEGLPESFIWHTIISLLRASTYLVTGRQALTATDCQLADDLEPIRGWKPISHNFIHPANVFYCHPKPVAGFKNLTYGTCKLGNFEKCTVFKNWNDKRDVIQLWDQDLEGEYTGYEAPELSSYWPQAEIAPGGLGDVWSIGACAVAMMTSRPIWELVMRQDITSDMISRRDEDWRTVVPTERFNRLAAMCRPDLPAGCTTLQQALPFTYSPVLRSIVEQMVFPGQYRPPPEFLLPQVMEEFALHCGRAEGLSLRAMDDVREQLIDAQAELVMTREAGDAETAKTLRSDTIPLLEERLANGVRGQDTYGSAEEYVSDLEIEDAVLG
ncbi:hypothetical protein LTR78_001876 [Recurvomyces mirabilis]|uniref:non-specific serine/threonine protein kinase n=2 Tax=Recurvomyces mirabilis TaxID=574656 RepID=A0AAE0WVE8_9PEZI|nr:hypothetical protein LTR78_001876 [Recurvomyces mirabilis]